jgi:hypothetical protein
MNGSRSTTLLASLILLHIAIAPSISTGQARISAQTGARETALVLSQQVWALQALHDLDLDGAQLELLRAAIPRVEDVPEPRPVDPPRSSARSKVPARYLATLESLRQALIHDKENGEAQDQIDELRDELESIREDEQVELDDRVQIADGARAKVPEVMKSLRPSQVAGYLAAYQDDVPDPVLTLVHAADDSRGVDNGKYLALAERTARDMSILLAGLDKDKAAPVAERVRQWLAQSRGQNDADFKAGRAELEKSARGVIGDVDSFDILRHWVERDAAELLSNPQLGAMIDERIKHPGK